MTPSNVSHLPNVQAYVGGSRPKPSAVAEPVERKRFVAKGHDAQLQEAQHSRRRVSVTTLSGEPLDGIIVRRDKFTITLETDDGQQLIVYKHAIESIALNANAGA